MELAALIVAVLAFTVERVLRERSARQERDAFLTQLEYERNVATEERRRIAEEATDERRELLTRITHPQLIVEKRPEGEPLVVEEDDDDWDKIGTVQPTVEVDD